MLVGGWGGDGGDRGSESLPVTDSPVWDWFLGLCPLAKENGGNPERRSSEGSSVKEGGSEGPFMCRGFGNFGFQTEGSAVRGVSLAKHQNKISSYCFMVHVPFELKTFRVVSGGGWFFTQRCRHLCTDFIPQKQLSIE